MSAIAPATARPGCRKRAMPGAAAASTEDRAGRGANGRSGPSHLGAVIARAVDIRAELREAAAAAAAAAARAHSVAELLDEALVALNDEGGGGPLSLVTPPADSQRGAASLSAREREVLALVAGGRSNKAIAEALYVSPNTVKTHVTSLLHKLEADSRVQLAVIATQHGLR